MKAGKTFVIVKAAECSDRLQRKMMVCPLLENSRKRSLKKDPREGCREMNEKNRKRWTPKTCDDLSMFHEFNLPGRHVDL